MGNALFQGWDSSCCHSQICTIGQNFKHFLGSLPNVFIRHCCSEETSGDMLELEADRRRQRPRAAHCRDSASWPSGGTQEPHLQGCWEGLGQRGGSGHGACGLHLKACQSLRDTQGGVLAGEQRPEEEMPTSLKTPFLNTWRRLCPT